MRRLLLALLLIAAPAQAGKTLVVRPATMSVGAATAHERHMMQFATNGMDVEVRTQQSLKTIWLTQNIVPDLSGSVLKTYSAIIVDGYRSLQGGPTGSLSLDSLTLAARWPGIPILYLTDSSIPSTIILAEAPDCSTGFANNPANSVRWKERMEWVNGSSPVRAWRSYSGSPRFTLTGTKPPGIFRIVLREGASPWYDYAKINLAPTNMDSVPAQSGDTVTLVARYRQTTGGAATGSPIITCVMGTGGGATREESDVRRLQVALAMLDSAAGNQVLFQTRSGPIVGNVSVERMVGSGRYTSTPPGGALVDLHFAIGMFAVSDSDSVTVKATIAAQQALGNRASIGVQTHPETLAAYANQLRWIRDLWPLAKVYPFNMAGVDTNVNAGNNSATRMLDLAGATRHRSLLPAGETDPRDGVNCSGDTLSVYCGYSRAINALVAAGFPRDRIDWVFGFPYTDFSPQYFSRNNGSMDSLKWVYSLLGVRGFRVGMMSAGNSVSQSGAFGRAPRGWRTNLSIEPVRDPATGRRVGTMAFLPVRPADSQPTEWLSATPHDVESEYLVGLMHGDWYTASRSPVYVNKHNFHVRTTVLQLSGAWLGGCGDPKRAWRPGHWVMKGLNDWARTVNRLGGREIVKFGYGEDVIGWLQESGLR